MKFIITGGHITPALAIVDKLKNQDIVFVGRKYISDIEETITLEYKEITKRKIKFIDLSTGRFTRIISTKLFLSLLKVLKGLYQGFIILRREKPDLVLSFGSYLAFPIAFWAWVFGIPVFTHEQAIRPGLANKIIGMFSKKIFVAFEETKDHFNKRKTVLTGNPVRNSIFKVKKQPFLIKGNLPIIYVTGGSLGSHSLNIHIKNILTKVLREFVIIHQTGDTKQYNDFEHLLDAKESLPKNLKNRYFLAKHFLEEDIGYIFSVSEFVISRAGANTFFELIALQLPAIFVPLPWSANKEQQHQAEKFYIAGVGEVFDQSKSSDELYKLIKNMHKNLNAYKANFKKLRNLYRDDATDTIIREISS